MFIIGEPERVDLQYNRHAEPRLLNPRQLYTPQGRSQDLLEGGAHAPPSSSLGVACLFHAEEIFLQCA